MSKKYPEKCPKNTPKNVQKMPIFFNSEKICRFLKEVDSV
jgi:hypothetical protein